MKCHLFASVPAAAEEQKMVTELTAVLKGEKRRSQETIVRQISTYPVKLYPCIRVKLIPSVLFCVCA